MSRHFFRCTDCLAVSAIDDPQFEYGSVTAATCGACGSLTFDHMGRVKQDRLVDVSTRCACDDRCTAARGPLCNCHCGGKNHGAGLAAVVTITTDRGAIPTITPTYKKAQHAARGADYRERLSLALGEFDKLATMKRTSYLAPDLYQRLIQLRALLRDVRRHRVHAARMRAFDAAGIAKVAPGPGPVDVAPRLTPIGPMATTQQGLF